jgi:hypothetical protein
VERLTLSERCAVVQPSHRETIEQHVGVPVAGMGVGQGRDDLVRFFDLEGPWPTAAASTSDAPVEA